MIPPSRSHRPVLAGPWTLLFRPEKHSSYVNDHTLFQDVQGGWHLYGCAQLPHEINPDNERYLVHGSTPSLSVPMTEHPPAINHGTRAWAPGAVTHNNAHYMYYGPSPTSMARSIDAKHWIGNPVHLIGTPLDAAHRDHMILKIAPDTWAMYAVGIHDGAGCVSVHVSNDLVNWRFVQYALTTVGAPLTPAWGAVESPFVVSYEGWYYLFITYTDCAASNYHNTLVFRSASPFDFGTYTGDDSPLVTKLHAHAAEVIFDPATSKWSLTTAGWRNFNTPHEGCVSIAPLQWEPAP